MNKKVLIAYAFFSQWVCHGQSFNNRYDFLNEAHAETPWSMELFGLDSVLIFVPHINDSGNVTLGLSAIDGFGVKLWDKSFGFSNGHVYAGLANSTNECIDGGYILGNSYNPFDDNGVLSLFRFDPMGDTLWTKYWPAHEPYLANIGYAAIETTDGGFLVVGTTYNDVSSKVLAIKTDAEGNEIWYKTYSGYPFNSHNAAVSACNSSDGGYIIGAQSQHEDENVDNTYFFKIDSSGNQQWETILESETNGVAPYLTSYGGGIYYTAGVWANFYLDAGQPYLIKFNENGDTLWSKYYSEVTDFYRWFSTPKKLSDGNLLLGGQWPGEGFDKGFLMKLDTAGNVIWDRKFYNVDGNHCRFTDYIELSDGFIAACGMANGSNELNLNQDSWVVKVDACGCLVPGCENGADCSQWVGLNDDPLNHELQQSFMIYPNPVRRILNIYLPPQLPNGECTFEIHDITGKLVRSFIAKEPDTTYMTDVGDLTSGVYFLSQKVNGSIIQTLRFVVE